MKSIIGPRDNLPLSMQENRIYPAITGLIADHINVHQKSKTMPALIRNWLEKCTCDFDRPNRKSDCKWIR